MSCAELTDRITDHLEDALTAHELRLVRAHLASCDGCQALLDQLRATVRLLGSAPPAHWRCATEPDKTLSEKARTRALQTFREWATSRPCP